MKTIIAVLVGLIIFISCREDSPSSIDAGGNSAWLRLEIPNARQAYAVAGDIDHTLLVTTWTKAYYTTDKGSTWIESKNFNGPVLGLRTINDSTFSYEARSIDSAGKTDGASLIQYVTTNYGKSWSNYYSATNKVLPIGIAKSVTGQTYFIKSNLTRDDSNSLNAIVRPSEIVKIVDNNQTILDFPFKSQLINLHIDKQNRLYVAASGGTYDEKTNTFSCCSENMPAVIYVSKSPM